MCAPTLTELKWIDEWNVQYTSKSIKSFDVDAFASIHRWKCGSGMSESIFWNKLFTIHYRKSRWASFTIYRGPFGLKPNKRSFFVQPLLASQHFVFPFRKWFIEWCERTACYLELQKHLMNVSSDENGRRRPTAAAAIADELITILSSFWLVFHAIFHFCHVLCGQTILGLSIVLMQKLTSVFIGTQKSIALCSHFAHCRLWRQNERSLFRF